MENVALFLCIGYLSLEALSQMVGMSHGKRPNVQLTVDLFVYIVNIFYFF